MRLGLFCTYENPARDQRMAFADQTRLVEHIEALGFDEAWIAEHHFNPDALSPASLTILAYLAAKTRHIRLGSAAVLLPYHAPLKIAEEVATLDLLSDGRFDFGVSKGGPFPLQNKHFGVDPDHSRKQMAEALTLINRLLYEDEVRFEGQFYRADGITLTPKPLQQPIPTYMATSTRETVLSAAHHGYGIMAGPPFPLAQVRDSAAIYRDLAGPAQDPNLILIRFYHVAPTETQAIDEARMLLKGFAERMQVATAKLQPAWSRWFDIDRLIADSLIGTPDTIAAKAMKIGRDLAPRSLILKQIGPDMVKRVQDLSLFMSKIQPDLLAA
jgi:alkanesulfonate monooxygenase SsuD/methylene tetrahydromethanopterin reductase-like flavin-dependent oxidoreductase (luciferase family)